MLFRDSGVEPEVLEPLPMAALRNEAIGSPLCHQVAAVDSRGRVSDKLLISFLGWQPGDRLVIELAGSLVATARRCGRSPVVLRSDRYLRLPVSVRGALGLRGGGRVFMVAVPHVDAVLVHHVSVLDDMVTGYYELDQT